MAFFDLNQMQGLPLIEGINSKAVYGSQCSVSFLDLKPMSRLPEHHHPNEQIGIVLKGEIDYTIGDDAKTCRKGDAFLIPPNTSHSAVVVSREAAQLLDIFAPPRDLNEPLNYTEK
jgi:quercetin dioxygenase-like cupin family protein